MSMKKMVGSMAAAVIAVGVASVPMSAQAAPAATTVSNAPAAVASAAVADRKKKKAKVSVAVAPNPAGCYNINLRVTKRGVPQPGAVVRIQSFSGGKWRNTPDAPVTTDANGAAAFVQAGLYNSSGGASNHKVRFKLNKKVASRGFRAPCASI